MAATSQGVRYVPGSWVSTPGTDFKIWQAGHWADRAGNWVAKPTSAGGTATASRGGGRSGRGGRGGRGTQGVNAGAPTFDPGASYQGLSDAEISARANQMADAQIAASAAAINRQQAMADAQARGDEAMYQGLGQAQMGMISQIPANIQSIRDTAAQALSTTAGQITGAQQQQA